MKEPELPVKQHFSLDSPLLAIYFKICAVQSQSEIGMVKFSILISLLRINKSEANIIWVVLN